MRTRHLSILVLATALFVVGLVAAPLSAQSAKLRALIVTGHDVPSHPWRKTTPFVREVLEKSGRFEVRVCEDVGIFESSTLSKYHVIVLNYGFWVAPELRPAGRAGLLKFVKDGGGLLCLHFASSSWQDWDERVELLGRVWKKGVAGHAPRLKFTVKIEDHEHPITKGLRDFEVDDELYSKLSGSAEIHVLASAWSDWSKRREPMVFVKTYGKGRVVHNVLGHDVKARSPAPCRALVARGAEWAATGKVTVD